MATHEDPRLHRAVRWFDIRRRQSGSWAFALNRITGIGLVVYLYLHLVVLSLLSKGAGSWDAFVSLARSPFILTFDVILLAGFLIHGLNGLRVTVTGLNVGVKKQKAIFATLMLVAIVALSAASIKIFGG